MVYALVFIIGLLIGGAIGLLATATFALGGTYDKVQEAYDCGFENGRNSVLEQEDLND